MAGESTLVFGTPGATGVWARENTREEIFGGGGVAGYDKPRVMLSTT